MWADLDIVFLRAIGSEDYLMGNSNSAVGNAVLKLPADSAILADYLAICRRRPLRYIMPW